jgi:hypothetical protein
MRRRELLWRDQGAVYRAMHMRGRRGARDAHDGARDAHDGAQDAHDGARDAHDGARDGRAGGVRCLVLPLLGAILVESPAELHHHARATTLEAAVLPLIATNCHYARATTLEAAVLRVHVRPAVGYTMTEGSAEPSVRRDCGVVSAREGTATKPCETV